MHQRRLAPDAVAKVAEQRRPNRPRQKRNAKRRQRRERGRRRVGRRKEQPRKHQHRRGGVNIEVEELDGGADQAGKQHLARAIHGHACPGVGGAHPISGFQLNFECFYANLSPTAPSSATPILEMFSSPQQLRTKSVILRACDFFDLFVFSA